MQKDSFHVSICDFKIFYVFTSPIELRAVLNISWIQFNFYTFDQTIMFVLSPQTIFSKFTVDIV